MDFLNSGKALYIEGNDFFKVHRQTDFYSYLGCSYLSDGYSNAVGNIQRVDGQTGTFTEGLSYKYTYKESADYRPDVIKSNGGTLLFASQDGKGRTVCYNGNSGCRVIYSSFVFGALKDGSGDNTKAELMKRYMNFFQYGSDNDKPSPLYGFVLCQNFPNPFNLRTTIDYSIDFRGHVVLNVYDMSGKRVRTLVDETQNNGTYRIMWDGKDGNGHLVSTGVYIYQITAGRLNEAKKMIFAK